MKVKISKKDWIKATLNKDGEFWCPVERQKDLLDVWPDDVSIEFDTEPETKCKCCGGNCLDLEVNPCGEIEKLKKSGGTDYEAPHFILKELPDKINELIEVVNKLNQIK